MQTAEAFVQKWSKVELSERAASQEHFIDLCRLLGQPTPAEADPTGQNYCFEKAVKVVAAASKGSKGEGGFVDAWKRGCFGWEYKRKNKYKSLDEAYRQLYQYRDALDNPPLSVVCDIRTTEIRTHFTGYPPATVVVRLEELPGKLEVLRRVFTNPESFRPFKKLVEVTAELAKEFGELAEHLIARFPPNDLNLFQRAGDPVAHFLMKVMFCLFAEDIGLLPDSLFTRLINRSLFEPDHFAGFCGELFDKMKKGGWYGNDRVDHFNGGLFDDAPPLALNHAEINVLARAAGHDWSGVEPSIFGTLFERILDPRKRAQIGAHYTSKDDILLVVDPVVMTPLRRQWQAVQDGFAAPLATHDAEPDRKKRDLLSAPVTVAIEDFRQHLHRQRVLDPACGSGNFLYVALQQMLDLEDDVVRFAARHDVYVDPTPRVRPTQMHGIEINPYAAELAQVVIWIGYLQWTKTHGIDDPRRPILDKLEMIENRDAILDLTDKQHPKRAAWPDAEFIIGNPPFLGGSMLWEQLGNEYRDHLWSLYEIPNFSDLCCYWFAQAGDCLIRGSLKRGGLLATQAVRFGASRSALQNIKSNGNIFNAWSDREWTLDGAAVHVSIIAFDDGSETNRTLNGIPVVSINADLSSGIDIADASALSENLNICLIGVKKAGPFDVGWEVARSLAADAGNPNSRPNTDVLRPVVNGIAVTRRDPGNWIIDYGEGRKIEGASDYAAPFELVQRLVKPERDANKRDVYRKRWWLFAETRPAMRVAQRKMARCLATPYVTKHRLFVWLDSGTLPADGLFIFARDDDAFMGVLQSSIHELWARRTGSQLREAESGFRYTPSTCFETFPFPWPPGKEETSHPAYHRIAAAAKALDEKRERWLNPPEWVDPLAAKVDAADDFADVPAAGRPLVRRSAIMAAAAKDARLKNRTLTKLYNERPIWLRLAHEQLDRAVLAAYAATDPAGGWSEDWGAVWVDTGAGQPLAADHPTTDYRRQVDQAVLAALLRLNGVRAGTPEAPAGHPSDSASTPDPSRPLSL